MDNYSYFINLFQTKKGSVSSLIYPVHHPKNNLPYPSQKSVLKHQSTENSPQVSISYNKEQLLVTVPHTFNYVINCKKYWKKCSVIPPLHKYSRKWYIIIERTKPYSVVLRDRKGKSNKNFTLLSQIWKCF